MLDEHFAYISDQVRHEKIQEAVAKVVRKGDRVADLGSGSGVLALLCLQAKAGHVSLIESSKMIELAEDALTRANWAKQIDLIHGRSHQVNLQERVDVIICDHVGYFGFDYCIIDTIQDARQRFLKPGGQVIPARINLQISCIESDICHKKAEGWGLKDIPPEFHFLRQYSINTKHRADLKPEEILGEPVQLAEIDLHSDNPEFFKWSADLCIKRNGTMHGVGGWFDCELAKDVWMTNSPLSPGKINRPQVFLPIDEPVEVQKGDIVKIAIMTRPAEHLITWIVEFPTTGQCFTHSTWQSSLFSSDDLVQSTPTRVPRLSKLGKARSVVLEYCDGQRTAHEIEKLVLQNHPKLLPSQQAISAFVNQTLHQDTQS